MTLVRGIPQHVCRGPYFFPGVNVLVAFITPTGGTRLGFSAFEPVLESKNLNRPHRLPWFVAGAGGGGIKEGGEGSLTPTALMLLPYTEAPFT